MKCKLAIMFGLLLIMGATLPISAGPALAADPDPVYLALGDSLAVGVGASDWNLFDPTTPSPALGYVPQFHEFLLDEEDDDLVLHNLGVGSEDSESFILAGVQLDAAITIIATTDVEVVTLTIGGNDLLGLLFIEPCASNLTGSECQDALVDALPGALESFGARYATILGTLTAIMNDDAELMVMTYFNPFDGVGALNPSLAILESLIDQALVGVDGGIDCLANLIDPTKVGLNDIIACTGNALGAHVVDVYPLFDSDALRLTHIGLPTLPFPSFGVHPNDDGYEMIWDVFKDEFKDGHDD